MLFHFAWILEEDCGAWLLTSLSRTFISKSIYSFALACRLLWQSFCDFTWQNIPLSWIWPVSSSGVMEQGWNGVDWCWTTCAGCKLCRDMLWCKGLNLQTSGSSLPTGICNPVCIQQMPPPSFDTIKKHIFKNLCCDILLDVHCLYIFTMLISFF